MDKNYDLIVIGTGSAASAVAYKCRKAGWNVAVVDSRPFGGTCALRGCDPKKVLVGAAELVDWHHRMAENGVTANEVKIDWPTLMRFKRTFTDPVPENREKGFSKVGIDIFHGGAHFVDEKTVKVGQDNLTGRHVLIATITSSKLFCELILKTLKFNSGIFFTCFSPTSDTNALTWDSSTPGLNLTSISRDPDSSLPALVLPLLESEVSLITETELSP